MPDFYRKRTIFNPKTTYFMKRLFFAVVALSMLATSCAKDEAAAPEATAKTVTFSVKAPELKTRAFTAPGNGANATTLHYAIYDEQGLVTGLSDTDGEEFNSSKKFEISLVEGKAYKAIFWAQNANSGYTVSMDTFESANVAMNYGTEVGNSEHYDAFWAVVTDLVNHTGDVEMKRPFAQLNIGVTTADIAKGTTAGVTVQSVKTTVEDVPTVFNLDDGTVGNVTATVTFDWVIAGATTIDLGTPTVNYTIFSTNYILVGNPFANDLTTTEKALTSVKFDMSEAPVTADEGEVTTAATATNNITRKFGNAVPVQANYRTFIVGDIITGGADNVKTWTVKIAPDFEDGDDEGTDPDDKIVDANAL